MAQSAQETSAELLEKTASYVEALEERNRELEQELQEKRAAYVDEEAQKLATTLKATGMDVDLSVAKKIAASEDKEVRELINKLASMEEVESIGNARRKNAASGNLANAGGEDDADAQFLNWCLS